MTFQLDPVLTRDTLAIGTTDTCLVRLMNDQRYLWILLIPTITGAVELFELDDDTRQRVLDDSASLGRDMMRLQPGTKFNFGVLGNIVRQLHLHHIVRREGDAAWPGPVWGVGKARPYSDDQAQQWLTRLRSELTLFV